MICKKRRISGMMRFKLIFLIENADLMATKVIRRRQFIYWGFKRTSNASVIPKIKPLTCIKRYERSYLVLDTKQC